MSAATRHLNEDNLRRRLQDTVKALHDVGIERSAYRTDLQMIAALVGAVDGDDTVAAVERLVRAARAYRTAHRRAMDVYARAGRSGVVLRDELGAALHIDTELSEQTGGTKP